MHRFLVVTERANGNCAGCLPDSRGCVSAGETGKEAEHDMHQAIELHVAGLLEDDLSVRALHS